MSSSQSRFFRTGKMKSSRLEPHQTKPVSCKLLAPFRLIFLGFLGPDGTHPVELFFSDPLVANLTCCMVWLSGNIRVATGKTLDQDHGPNGNQSNLAMGTSEQKYCPSQLLRHPFLQREAFRSEACLHCSCRTCSY